MSSVVPLPSRLATGDLALASVTAVLRGIGSSRQPSPDRIAMAYRSDQLLRIDGVPPSVWSPFSGFWRGADGWLRTHGNYPHHARALCHGLGVPMDASADDLRAIFAAASVLDLTRVIAGPVCTRTLALLGADVLRIDPQHLAEPEWQHLDTGHGKRSALLNAWSAQMTALLAEADVVVLGYRPVSLARLGLSPDSLGEQHPGLIIAQLSAWGLEHPERAGFDSLVQAESGIAMIESPDGERPGALPAQALDHSAGYLLAASICETLARRDREGGSWHISTSLRRVAAELLGMPRRDVAQPEIEIDANLHSQEFSIDGHTVVTAASALPGFSFAAPRPWGGDYPQWRSPRTAPA